MIRLLVVDDRDENLYLLQALLEGNGYHVVTAHHGAEALLRARQEAPNLVVSDLLMPVMDGFTLLRHWKADDRLRRIPFVVYTATYTEPKDERLALDLGADAFILKPAEPEEFIARIKEVLDRAEAAQLKASHEPIPNEKALLSGYSEVLVRKLEDKLMEVEEATRRAQASEERLRLALDAGGMGMWDWDLGTGRIVWCENHARLFGLKLEEFDGRYESFQKLVHPDDLALLEAKLGQARSQLDLFQHKFRVIWPDGSEHWIAGQGRCFCDSAQEPLRMCGVVMDITGRVREKEERAKLEAQLQQAQKMESIGRLAGGVAHDFNNALGPVLGYAELLLAELAPGDPRHEELEQIRQAGIRARDLTRQLLAFGRKQVLTLVPVDLRGVLSGFEKLLRRTVREDIHIEMRLPDTLGMILADVGQIEQVLMNLVINAQDAMPEGGVLSLTLADVVLDEEYAGGHPEVAAGRYVELTVSDTGTGMDQETLRSIFEPFFTTKESGKGTGLGLSMVYGIVKQHGGGIWVYSEPSLGTRFKIYLPRNGESTDHRVISATPIPEMPCGSETVLVAEDNQHLLKMTVELLERQGYRVIARDSAQACLDLVRAYKGPIDLLLTDVIMPTMNGRELYERLATLRPGLKVLYMSGYTDDMIARQGIMHNGVEFIQKPFTVSALTQKVRELLDKSDP